MVEVLNGSEFDVLATIITHVTAYNEIALLIMLIGLAYAS